MKIISEQNLKSLLQKILQQAGSDEYEAGVVAEHLLAAGESVGLSRSSLPAWQGAAF